VFAEAKACLRTPRDLLRFAVSRFLEANLFFGHGFASAYDEAAYLILHTLNLPLDRLEPFLDARLLPGEIETVLGVLHRRVEERIPAAYLTREAWLAEHKFYVDERVLVPRSFIAESLREGLSPWIADPEKIGSVLDLCTGSGCLAILAALAFPNAAVDAADVSRAALEVARRNVDDYALAGRVRLLQSDMLRGLRAKRYDLILCNPPYVNAQSMQTLPPEYRCEPELALAGGGDGLDYIRMLLREARPHLKKGALLVVEAGHNKQRLEQAFGKLPFTWLDTSGGADFVFLLTREDLN
jgi:ribosomal protein L3 glutamine methyltransferase